MKILALTIFLGMSQAFAGELLMDCSFEKSTKTFSLSSLDINDGRCHTGTFEEANGPFAVRYEIELCGQEATGIVTIKTLLRSSQWDNAGEFSTRSECRLRRRIESAPRRCTPARSHC